MLEAMVAVGVLAACLLPLLDFQLSVASGAERLTARQAGIELEARAVSYLRALPPEALSEGEADLGDARLSWQIVSAAPARRAISEQGAPGRFEVQLVRLEFELRQGDSLVKRSQMDRMSWRSLTPLFDR